MATATTSQTTAPKDATQDAAAGATPPGPANVTAEVYAAMDEFIAYSEGVFAIMREYGSDCDRAAKELQTRVATFHELGRRLMRMKEQVKSLPAADQHAIMERTNKSMDAFKARYPDADALAQTANACEKSSAAFAEVSPKVMFTKKK